MKNKELILLLMIAFIHSKAFSQNTNCNCLNENIISINEYSITFRAGACMDTIKTHDKYNNVTIISYNCGEFMEVKYFHLSGMLKSEVSFISDTLICTNLSTFLDSDNPDNELSSKTVEYVRTFKHGMATFYDSQGNVIQKEMYSYDKKIMSFSIIDDVQSKF